MTEPHPVITRAPVGIVGLGLIGGSAARDLLRLGVPVIAYDRDESLAHDTSDATLRQIRRANALREVAAAPVLVIAVPVGAALEVLDELAPFVTDAHLVMDVGSTKREIVARAGALGIGSRFVGCHPLAGSHRDGWAASREALFRGAPVSLCHLPHADSDAVSAARAFWEWLGACPRVEDAESHDARMAYVSHLPHLVSVALADTLRDHELSPGQLGPGGRDMTRLAGGAPELWTQIAAQNQPALCAALDAFEAALSRIRAALRSGDWPALERQLDDARGWTRS